MQQPRNKMANPVKILVSDPLSEEGIEMLKSIDGVQVDTKSKLKPEELLAIIGEYEGLVIRSGTQVTKEVLAKAKKLKVIGRAGAGLDNVDVETASKMGVVVMNAAGGNTVSTAEHTMSMLLSMTRKIPQACASLKAGKWERTSFMGGELYGKYLGIVGMGKVGTEVARRAHAFGMRLVVFDPYLSLERVQELEAEPVKELNELFKKSDYITIHTPLNTETKALIGAEELAMMKKGVRIVNCARGGIIDEKALTAAIQSGHVAGAAIDVFEQEPPVYTDIIQLPQVVVTPHLAASTEEAQKNVAREIALSVRDFLQGKGIRNAVNVPSVDAETLKLIDPYLKLIERLGMMQGQLIDGAIKEVHLKFVGELTRWSLAPLTVAFMKGLLSSVMSESVNYVNASMIAKDRGIKVIETKATDGEDFANLIATTVITDKKTSQIDGTLFTRSDPRIVRVDEFYVDAVPAGAMLIVRNQDKPGMVGRVGTILGSHNINIGWMSLGRRTQGGDALIVLNLDQPLSDELFAEIKKEPLVIDVKRVQL